MFARGGKMKRFCAAVCFVLVLAGCVAAGPSRPVHSSHFVTQGAGFIVDGASVKYAMNYTITKPFSELVYIATEFENPMPGGSPLITEKTLEAGVEALAVRSPPLPGIENNKSYAAVLRVYSDPERTHLIAEHKQAVFFGVPDQILRAKGIKQY